MSDTTEKDTSTHTNTLKNNIDNMHDDTIPDLWKDILRAVETRLDSVIQRRDDHTRTCFDMVSNHLTIDELISTISC